MSSNNLTSDQNKAHVDAKKTAQQHLLVAEKLIREKKIAEAKLQVEKAKELDPTNAYIKAFTDRIKYFESRNVQEVRTDVKPVSENVSGQPNTSSFLTQSIPKAQPPKPQTFQHQDVRDIPESKVATPSIHDSASEKNVMEAKLEAMMKQVEMLSKELAQEKKAREELSRSQFQHAVNELRTMMSKAWAEGAPSEETIDEFLQFAVEFNIPEHVIKSVQREVKIDAYSNAVKQIASMKHSVRNSASSLEWLRKVYDISENEYLEYESKFLSDLVTDEFKGTILEITADEETKSELNSKLKEQGYAIVICPTPEDALEKIENLHPNCVICESDFGHGSISGIRFLHFLRNNSKFNFVPFIFIAGDDDYSLLSSSELRTNEGFVKKPVMFDELLMVMNAKLEHLAEYSASVSK